MYFLYWFHWVLSIFYGGIVFILLSQNVFLESRFLDAATIKKKKKKKKKYA